MNISELKGKRVMGARISRGRERFYLLFDDHESVMSFKFPSVKEPAAAASWHRDRKEWTRIMLDPEFKDMEDDPHG